MERAVRPFGERGYQDMTVTGEMVIRRRGSAWSVAVVASMVVHIFVILLLNQIPTAKVRLVRRDIVMTVDLLEPTPPPEIPEESPPEERGEFREPPPTNLLDMSAVALPEPGQDLFNDLPEPSLDITQEEILPATDPLSLPQDERDLFTTDDKLSALSLSDEFSLSLPGDKPEAGSRTGIVLREASTDELAPRSNGPARRQRKVGYTTSQPVERTSGIQHERLRDAGAARSLAQPRKGGLGPPERPKAGRSRKRLRLVEPPVPTWVEEQGIETFSKIRFQILENGKIGTVELTTSSGYRELDNLAIGAVKKWLYEPGLMEYRSVKINFKLK
jgi:TonB family protein